MIKIPHIFIPNNTPSSKNSKQIGFIFKGKGLGKKKIPTLRNSDLVTKYKKDTGVLWSTYAKNFHRMIEKEIELGPLKIGLYFVRDSRRKFDYNNSSQIICDLMQLYGWVDNDDSSSLIPVFLGYHVNKNAPGIYICIIKNEDYNSLTNKYIE